MQGGVSHTQADFMFLANGGFVYRQETFCNMEAVQTGNNISSAVRSPGYGKPLAIGKSKTATLHRFVNRSWYRLTDGGPPLGPSAFFALASVLEPLLIRVNGRPIKLEAGKYVLNVSGNAKMVLTEDPLCPTGHRQCAGRYLDRHR
jgi:hypothetical protein